MITVTAREERNVMLVFDAMKSSSVPRIKLNVWLHSIDYSSKKLPQLHFMCYSIISIYIQTPISHYLPLRFFFN